MGIARRTTRGVAKLLGACSVAVAMLFSLARVDGEGVDRGGIVTPLPPIHSDSVFNSCGASQHLDADSEFPILRPAPNNVRAASWDEQFDEFASPYDPRGMDESWLDSVQVGYDNGFVIASERSLDLYSEEMPFSMRINGLGQLRHTYFDSFGDNPDVNQLQLIRARLKFTGSAFTDDFEYYVQLDGRSSSGDQVRLLDYELTYDVGHHRWGFEKGTLGYKAGKYKIPFSMARAMSSQDFEFTDRSMASMYFDANRSLAWGLYGRIDTRQTPFYWEVALFNGLVTGGAETGSAGNLDTNFAYSTRIHAFPIGDWGNPGPADLRDDQSLAVQCGAGAAFSKINRSGSTEFDSIRVVDSGAELASLLPLSASAYSVSLFAVDFSTKCRGWSWTSEYYFRVINDIEDAAIPDLYDHGFWLQLGKFVVPKKFQLLTRWSRVVGDSGTLGVMNQSADEIAGGCVWYFHEQNAKWTFDATYLDGAPINSASLGIIPGDIGWLFRSQIQFAF